MAAMKKEVVFAILAGGALGLVIAFGVWRANSALKPANTNNQTVVQTPSPQGNVELSIIKPENLVVVTTASVEVTGSTIPNALVAISAEEKDYVVVADNKGSFSQTVSLTGGLNEIKVFSFDVNDGVRQKDLLVVYSSEFAKFLSDGSTTSASGSAEVSTSTDSVRQKVNEKISLIEKSPTAYIGTVTDITDSNIQIKDQNGEIQQIATDKDQTDYVKNIDTAKTIESTDLAIGDFVIAMGLKNGNKVLDGKRIVVTEPFKSSTRTAIFGSITDITKKVVTLKDNSEKETSVTFGTNWDGPEISELKAGDKIIVTGEIKDSTFNVSLVKKV